MANAVLQSTKAISYLEGKHIGKGPSLESLIQRGNQSSSKVVRIVNAATSGTPMYKVPTPLTGDKESTRHKRHSSTVINIEDYASHWPEYNVHVKDRKQSG